MRLRSFLSALFRRRRPPPASPAPAPAADPPAQAPEETLAPPAPPPVAVVEAPGEPPDEDGDDWCEEAEEDSEDGPDPFISEPAADVAIAVDVEALRRHARAEALSGEHKLPLASAAGPGSLAEALNLLLAEGRVQADFVDDPQAGPYMLYRPLAAQDA